MNERVSQAFFMLMMSLSTCLIFKPTAILAVDNDKAKPTTGIIKGLVMHEGKPVEGIIISLKNGIHYATTDRNGEYTITDVPAGKHRISAFKFNDGSQASLTAYVREQKLEASVEGKKISTVDFNTTASDMKDSVPVPPLCYDPDPPCRYEELCDTPPGYNCPSGTGPVKCAFQSCHFYCCCADPVRSN